MSLKVKANAQTGKTKMLYKGHKGPVTCVRLYEVGGPSPWLALITSSWDKTIRIWDANVSPSSSLEPNAETNIDQSGELVCALEGHSDFVKSVTVLPTTPPTLISTSSDKSFRLWDLTPLETRAAPTFKQVVKDHTRPVDSAAYAVAEDGSLTVWTADSMGVLKQWSMPLVRITNTSNG